MRTSCFIGDGPRARSRRTGVKRVQALGPIFAAFRRAGGNSRQRLLSGARFLQFIEFWTKLCSECLADVGMRFDDLGDGVLIDHSLDRRTLELLGRFRREGLACLRIEGLYFLVGEYPYLVAHSHCS